MGKVYVIKLVTIDDQSTELTTRAPEITPTFNLEIKETNITLNSKHLKVKVTYKAESNGTDTLHILLFTYLSYEKKNRTLYIFYDPEYMTAESIKRADTIIQYFKTYNVTINKIDYRTLEGLSKETPERIILIIVNPLKDGHGRRLENSLPAPIIDPDRDGYIKDDSKYGKSFIYDWMEDKGLILVTIGSLQPHKKILYDNGAYTPAKDSYDSFDAHLIFTEASGKESIIKGRFTIGSYTPVRISGTLGLSYRDASFGFDKDAIERYNLQYYAYGDYKLPYENGTLNLTLPIFLRTGEGGWLAMGDGEYWLSDERLAHDLFLIYLQAVWDSKWIPYGWYWDSGGVFNSYHGIIRIENSLKTESIPRRLQQLSRNNKNRKQPKNRVHTHRNNK